MISRVLLPALALATLAGCSSDPVGSGGVLVTGEHGVTSIAADESFVYFATAAGDVKRVSFDGGKPELLVANAHAQGFLSVDATRVVYATREGLVQLAPKTGGAATTLAITPKVTRLATLDDTVCFATAEDAIAKVSKQGGPTTTLATGQATTALAAAGADVVWANDAATGALRAIGLAGGSVRDLVAAPTGPLDTRAGKAFFASIADQTLDVVGLEGGDTSVLADLSTLDAADQGPVVSIAAHDQQVFFATTTGSIGRAPIAGGAAPDMLVRGPSGAVSLAVNATSLVWANATDGSIAAMPIPSTSN